MVLFAVRFYLATVKLCFSYDWGKRSSSQCGSAAIIREEMSQCYQKCTHVLTEQLLQVEY